MWLQRVRHDWATFTFVVVQREGRPLGREYMYLSQGIKKVLSWCYFFYTFSPLPFDNLICIWVCVYLFANIGTLQCSLEKRFPELFRVGCINERVQTWSMFSFLLLSMKLRKYYWIVELDINVEHIEQYSDHNKSLIGVSYCCYNKTLSPFYNVSTTPTTHSMPSTDIWVHLRGLGKRWMGKTSNQVWLRVCHQVGSLILLSEFHLREPNYVVSCGNIC